ncbi:cytochrome c oxidase assembly protein COX16 homolog, mitochondrial isoform X1 [Sturnira hondurensis]|uniref:cytochrome c oxidase assembly protein COX16 homolog, mitochondrial isoform X1 n=1 Tax=Sturnira hondurensis TaxID=192404 RepID=UPI0018794C06|nr:cytochrome c oxidase assembly protein COX16 homolog, mitochondrial isoform X1 [Sturnira hondurensis]
MFAHAVMRVTRALRKNKTLRYGVPMLVLIVGGSFGLREFSQIRYDAVKVKIDPELEKKLKMNKVSLESEYEREKDINVRERDISWLPPVRIPAGGQTYNLLAHRVTLQRAEPPCKGKERMISSYMRIQKFSLKKK